MGRIIAIANQKGGVGKTTTAINLAACLAKKGKKVLAIDMDPQGNMTSGLGVDKNSLEYSVYDMLNGDCNLGECMLIDVYPDIKGLNLLPASRELAGAEVEFVTVEDPQYILKNHIKNVRRKFDYIIIDCPPALGMLTVNALTACRKGNGLSVVPAHRRSGEAHRGKRRPGTGGTKDSGKWWLRVGTHLCICVGYGKNH